MGELAGEGSFAVSVGIGDRWRVTGDMLYVECDMFIFNSAATFSHNK